MKKLSAEEQRSGLAISASNSVSESLHGALTDLLQFFGTISIPHAAAMGQSRTNNDHGRARKNLVTGRKSKKTVDSKNGSYLEGTAKKFVPRATSVPDGNIKGVSAEAQEEHVEVDALEIRDTEDK